MVLKHSDRKNSTFLKQEKISSGPVCVIIFLESKFKIARLAPYAKKMKNVWPNASDAEYFFYPTIMCI